MKEMGLLAWKWIAVGVLMALIAAMMFLGLGTRRGTRLYNLRLALWMLVIGLGAGCSDGTGIHGMPDADDTVSDPDTTITDPTWDDPRPDPTHEPLPETTCVECYVPPWEPPPEPLPDTSTDTDDVVDEDMTGDPTDE